MVGIGLQSGDDGACGTRLIVQVDLDDRGLGSAAEALGEAGAASVEGGIADLLVDADGVLDTQGRHLLARALAGRELILPDVGEDAEVLVDVGAGVGGDDRDARGDRTLDGGAERGGIRDGHHEALRVLANGGGDELGHGVHVERRRRRIVDGDAVRGHVCRGGVDAVDEDRPERVGGLAVGHDLDVDGTSGRGRLCRGHARGECRACQQAGAQGQADSLAYVHPLLLLARWALPSVDDRQGPDWCRPQAFDWLAVATSFGCRGLGVPRPGISVRATGRCSWSDRVAASATRSDSTPSRAVQDDPISPRATARNATSSARYASGKRSMKPGHAGPAGGGTPGSTDRMGVRGPRPTLTLSRDPNSSVRMS